MIRIPNVMEIRTRKPSAKRPLRSGPGSQFVWSLFPKIRCLRDKNSLENIFGIKEDKGRIPQRIEEDTEKQIKMNKTQ